MPTSARWRHRIHPELLLPVYRPNSSSSSSSSTSAGATGCAKVSARASPSSGEAWPRFCMSAFDSSTSSQYAAIARVLARDPDARNGTRVGAAAEGHHIPGGAAARNVHTADQRLAVEAVRHAPPSIAIRV